MDLFLASLIVGSLALEATTLSQKSSEGIEIMKEIMAKKLGFDSNSAQTGEQLVEEIPPFLQSIYNRRVSGTATDEELFPVIRTIKYKENIYKNGDALKIHLRFSPTAKKDESIRKAVLRLTLSEEPRTTTDPKSFRIKIFDIIKPQRGSRGLPVRSLIYENETNENNIVLSQELSQPIKRWMKMPRTNHGIDVEIVESSQKTRKKRSSDQMASATEFPHIKPLLLTYSDDADSTRTPRFETEFRKTYREGACKRKDFYISFKDMGYDKWVKNPEGFNAFTCTGRCDAPFAADTPDTPEYVIFKTFLHNKFDSLPAPSCVPTEFLPLKNVLFIDEDGPLIKDWADAVVASCGCR